MILATAEMLCEQVRLCGNASDFVGHIGGDDFVVMSTPSRIEIISKNLILQFDEKIKTFYDADDLKNGCIHIVSRRGEMTQYPILSISMAIVTNELRRFGSCHKVNDVGREVQKKAKTMSGSAYFKDRRRD